MGNGRPDRDRHSHTRTQGTGFFLTIRFLCFDRAKVKNGLKIISTQTTNPAWSLSFDVNGKHIAAAVTAVRNFSVSTQPHQPRFVQFNLFFDFWKQKKEKMII